MSQKSKIQYLLIALALLLLQSAHGQQGKGYAVHANIIYHFTKYIDWPDHLKSGDFVIGVIGGNALRDELKRVTGNKSVGNQKIVIRKFDANADAYPCHILYIADDEVGNLKRIVAGTAATSILIVTETDGAGRKGACINFVVIDDRLRLEINKTNIEKRKLNIATELLQLGTVLK